MDFPKIKEFHLVRDEDESGISGTGIVARGVILPSGKAVMEWITTHSSLCVYNNIQDVGLIHGHGTKTKVVLGPPPGVLDIKIEAEHVEEPTKKLTKKKVAKKRLLKND